MISSTRCILWSLCSLLLASQLCAASGGGAKMVEVRAGSYQCGSADDLAGLFPGSDSLVTSEAFLLSKTEVSNEEFVQFLNAGNDAHFDRRMEILRLNKTYTVAPGRAAFPVCYVDWEGATAYAKWAGVRLPRAYELEAAARGPRGQASRIYSWGLEPTQGKKGNCQETQRLGQRYTWPADSGKASAGFFGHLNLSGNLSEWTSDTWSLDTASALVKGGSWADPEINLRSAICVTRPKTMRSAFIGFRVAK